MHGINHGAAGGGKAHLRAVAYGGVAFERLANEKHAACRAFIGDEFGALEGQVRAQPVPEADRMTDRYRREAETLHALLQCDIALIGRAELLRGMTADANGASMLERESEIQAGLKAIARSLRERQAILQA